MLWSVKLWHKEGFTPHPSDPGSTPQDITDLVEAVGRHPRALVLLAREVARRGVRATTATVRELMTALHVRYPDDREQSLYASVELSLRRLAPEVRTQLQPLAVFQGGVNLTVWRLMTGADAETIRNLADAVIGVGLGTYMGYVHLRLDPALPLYLLRELSQADQRTYGHAGQMGWSSCSVFCINNGSRTPHSPRNWPYWNCPTCWQYSPGSRRQRFQRRWLEWQLVWKGSLPSWAVPTLSLRPRRARPGSPGADWVEPCPL